MKKAMSAARQGFTLIELIIVISVTAVLSVIGIAAFVDYSRTQALTAATQDVTTLLNVAKSRAQSQVKPETDVCATSRLDGYRVILSISQKTYELSAVCGGNTLSIANQTKKLPVNISFDATSETSIQFNVLTGGIVEAGDIKINGYGRSKTISIESGNIIVR